MPTLHPQIITLWENHFRSPITSATHIGGGGFGNVFEVVVENVHPENTFIIKTCKHYKLLAAESMYYSYACKHTKTMLFPTPIALHPTSAHYKDCPPHLLMTKLLGTPIDKINKSHTAKNQQLIASTVADTLHEIHTNSQHQKHTPKYGFITSKMNISSWENFYLYILISTQKKIIPFFEKHPFKHSTLALKLLNIIIKNFDYIFSEPVTAPALLHGDLWQGNILVDEKTCKPTGILDPLNPMWGDPEYDLFPLLEEGGRHLKMFETYKEKYPTSKNVDLKCWVYYLVSELQCRITANSWKGFGGAEEFYEYILDNLKNELTAHGICNCVILP